jgi:hypothetical protein
MKLGFGNIINNNIIFLAFLYAIIYNIKYKKEVKKFETI